MSKHSYVCSQDLRLTWATTRDHPLREGGASELPALGVEDMPYDSSPFPQRTRAETRSDIAAEVYCTIDYNKLSSILGDRKGNYRRGGVARYIEKPNRIAVENAIANPPIQILRVLAPIT